MNLVELDQALRKLRLSGMADVLDTRLQQAQVVPRQAPVADELAQRVLGADMEQVVQLLADMSCRRLVDERLGGGDQGAGA